MSNGTVTTCTNYIDSVSQPPNVAGGTVSSDPCPASTAVATCSGVDAKGNRYEQVFYSPPVMAAGIQSLMVQCASQGGTFSTGAYSPPWEADGGAEAPDGGVMRDAGDAAGQHGDGSADSGDVAGDGGLPVLMGATAIAVGEEFACALLGDHTVDCWGEGTGQVDGGPMSSPSPVPVEGLTGVTAIAAGRGSNFACALLDDGSVKCWGDNTSGQLGNGTMSRSSTPTTVTGLSGATAITLGYGVACALTPNGTECWGAYAEPAQTMFSQATSALVPALESNLADATTVAIVEASMPPEPCALFKDGSIQCTSPIANLTGATFLSVGSVGFACALLTDGAVDCWGLLDFVGKSSDEPPTKIFPNARAITSGDGGFVCALLADKSVQCVGFAPNAPNGTGVAPLPVQGLTGATAIGSGSRLLCALMDDTTVRCLGDNSYGQLGRAGPDSMGVGTVVAPGSVCPALLRCCNALMPLYRDGCLKGYQADVGNEDRCGIDLAILCGAS
jgi:Regulator of chromosome condensation (RCC1) repeat